MGKTPVIVRPISTAERVVLERAVTLAPAAGVAIPPLAGIDSLQVVGRCDCGCASVDFAHLPGREIATLVADAMAENPAGEHVNVLVWAYRGAFSGLEIVGYSDRPTALPVAETVRAWGPLPE